MCLLGDHTNIVETEVGDTRWVLFWAWLLRNCQHLGGNPDSKYEPLAKKERRQRQGRRVKVISEL